MNVLIEKAKEVLYSVLPITLIVLLLHFTLTPLDTDMLIKFLIGAAFIIVGLSIFLFGVDIGITPIGNNMGSSLAKSNKLWIVIISGLILGFFISVAEPDLHILAGQVAAVSADVISKLAIVLVVSLGVGVMISLGLVRILYNMPLYKLLAIIYALILILGLFTSKIFLAISFDASGATTGALTVPFILALALGVSHLKKDSKASERDSFGLVGIASSGAIIAVMLMSIIADPGEITGSLPSSSTDYSTLLGPFLHELPKLAGEIAIALAPILILFLLFQKVAFRLSKRNVSRILKGLVYTFTGLVLFLAGVNAGFMEVGAVLGAKLASLDSSFFVILVGFVLGLVTILAEPAVHVLTHQIEEVTSGYVKRKAVLFALSIGVAIAVTLSVIRILIPEIQLWHYLLPGYIIAVVMSFFSPKLFVGIAFDSGGVASGPMTATFILSFTTGISEAIEGSNILVDGFGVIAMVALTPLIALQILGFIFKYKSRKGGNSKHAEQSIQQSDEQARITEDLPTDIDNQESESIQGSEHVTTEPEEQPIP